MQCCVSPFWVLKFIFCAFCLFAIDTHTHAKTKQILLVIHIYEAIIISFRLFSSFFQLVYYMADIALIALLSFSASCLFFFFSLIVFPPCRSFCLSFSLFSRCSAAFVLIKLHFEFLMLKRWRETWNNAIWKTFQSISAVENAHSLSAVSSENCRAQASTSTRYFIHFVPLTLPFAEFRCYVFTICFFFSCSWFAAAVAVLHHTIVSNHLFLVLLLSFVFILYLFYHRI